MGVGVNEAVGVSVGVFVAVYVAVGVLEAVGVSVGVLVAVCVGVLDGVSVRVGVVDAVAEGVLVGVALGMGLVPAGASYAPRSQTAVPSELPSMGRIIPRWSRLFTGELWQMLLSPASMAGLPESRACVKVGPPLSASGPVTGSPCSVKPVQVPSESRFGPIAMMVP